MYLVLNIHKPRGLQCTHHELDFMGKAVVLVVKSRY